MKIRSWADFFWSRKKNKKSLLNTYEETFLIEHKNEEKAMEILLENNKGLIKTIALRHKDRGVDYEDLLTHGNIGLIEAINRFDVKSGYKLSTYAYHYIGNAIKTAIENESKTIRIPAHQYEAMSKINKWSFEPISDEELQSKTGLTKKQIETARNAFIPTQSLSLEEGDEWDIEDQSSSQENLTAQILSEEALVILESAGSIYKSIVEMMYGFLGEPYTMNEIAKELLITPNEVMTLHNEALKLLRASFK